MYGSIFHLHPKPGQKAAIRQLFEQWDRERAPRVQGFHAGYLFQPDRSSDELIGVAIFADRESYRKNATDPKQDEWYRSLRALLTEDPRWEDGEIIEAAERT
jgi:quinol monooxygenase YgiN